MLYTLDLEAPGERHYAAVKMHEVCALVNPHAFPDWLYDLYMKTGFPVKLHGFPLRECLAPVRASQQRRPSLASFLSLRTDSPGESHSAGVGVARPLSRRSSPVPEVESRRSSSVTEVSGADISRSDRGGTDGLVATELNSLTGYPGVVNRAL